MSQNVLPPFPVFVGRDGLAIDGGRIYIGNPNADPVLSPKSVFYDVAMTVPAAQPLRTSGGLIYRNGTPTSIYVNGDYSIRVTNENNELVYSAASAEIRITTDGDVTIPTGGNMLVQLGGSIAMEDGSGLSLGDGAGAGVTLTVAATTRVTGNWSPDINGRDLGNSGQRWDLFAGAIDATSMEVADLEVTNEDQPTTTAELAFANRRTLILASCRQTSTTATAATNNIYNVASINRASLGIYDVTLTETLDNLGNVAIIVCPDGQGLIANTTLSSSNLSVIRVNIYSAPAAAAVDAAFSFVVTGYIPA